MQPTNDYGRYAGLGLTFAGTIVVMGALGYGLDVWLGSLPWLMIVGILLGSVGGLISIVKKVSLGPGPTSPDRPSPKRPANDTPRSDS